MNAIKGIDEDLRNFTAQTGAFSFWEDKREDIYQDDLRTQPQRIQGILFCIRSFYKNRLRLNLTAAQESDKRRKKGEEK